MCGCGSSRVTLDVAPDYANELKKAILGNNFDAIAVNRDCTGNIGKLATPIDQILSKLKKCIDSKKWTFIVFSETFFGNNGIMDEVEVNTIVTKCNDFSAKYKNVLIHINFLHKFTNDNRPLWLPELGIQEGDIASARIVCAVLPDDKKETVFAQRDINLRISNYSILIWLGKPISFYRKSTYCNEVNALVVKKESGNYLAGDYVYEFGDFQDHIVTGIANLV